MFILAIIMMGVAYVVGSLNSAILVCKALHLADPRTEGSGNPGATNVFRMHGKKAAWIVLAGDVIKGFLPVLVAHVININGFLLACVGLAAVVGHMFPFFFKFKGGKGVATALGVLIGLSPGLALISLIVWGVVVFLTKYISLASLISAVLAAVLMLFAHTSYFLPLLVLVALVIWRHKDNIDRLKAGTENKIQFGKS